MPQPTWLEKAERYMASAQLLLEAGDTADVDSSLSRTYYAVRYACLYFLEQQGLVVDRKWLHESVLNQTVDQARNKQWLRSITMSGQKGLAKSLNRLLVLRGNADYSQGGITKREAEHALEFARALVEAIKDNLP